MLKCHFSILTFVFAALLAFQAAANDQARNSPSQTANNSASALFSNDAAWELGGTFSAGTKFNVGYGGDATTSFGQAMWGNDLLVGSAYSAAGASANLYNYAQGGDFGALSAPITDNTRASIGWAKVDESLSSNDDVLQPSSAMAFSLGVATSIPHTIGIGLTASALRQKNGLLNQTYNLNQGYGDTHMSGSLGVSTFVNLGPDRVLMLDAASIISDSSSMPDALLDRVSVYHAHSLGLAYGQSNNFTGNDQLVFAISKPLIITSGSNTSGVLSVDDQGYLDLVDQKYSARTGGDSETKIAMTYNAPLRHDISVDASLALRKNADNVPGYNSTDMLVDMTMSF